MTKEPHGDYRDDYEQYRPDRQEKANVSSKQRPYCTYEGCKEVCVDAENKRLREFLQLWIYEGRLQSFEGRERFRKAAQALVSGTPSPSETNGLQRDANRYRYLRERGLFDRYAVRERLADGHLPVFQTRHGEALDRELDECIGQTSPEEPSPEPPGLICNKCGVDRFKATCPNRFVNCPMHGTTQQVNGSAEQT